MAAAIFGTLVAFAQNWLEDHTAMPALMKARASSGNEPVVVGPARSP
jgi:hypothetical protein